MILHILVGTTSGTADIVAQSIAMACGDLVDDIRVSSMEGQNIGVFDSDGLYLICCATYGSGDVPDSAACLYMSLLNEPRYLGHVRYGVMSLGDEGSYPQTFAMGGRRFDAVLSDLGARRIGDVWVHDASSDVIPEADGVAWCRSWLALATG